MRKLFIIGCLLPVISITSFGQTFDNTTRVKNFIKVWGFLKYYHPLIATGNIDWDSVFINRVQKIIDSKNPAQFNNQILAVINSVKKPAKIEPRKLPDPLFVMNKVNINWIINSKLFDATVKSQLLYINDNKNQDTNRYIKMNFESTDFSGEKKYDSIGFPNMKYRLLFLSRYWNIINYFAPYKYLTTNWDNVLQKFIPNVIASTDHVSYYKTLLQLCKSLNDGHSQLTLPGQASATDAIYGKYTVPFFCEIIDGKVVIRHVSNDSISKSLNIQQGDIILKINRKDMQDIISDRRKYISASNQITEMHLLSKYILDGDIPAAELEILRGNQIFKTTVTRIPTVNRDWRAFFNHTANNVGYEKLGDSILLIYAGQIWDGNIDTMKYLIKQAKAVIFDIRNYPRNDAFYYIADPFLSEPKTINYSTVALPAYPGYFKWRPNPNKIGHFSDSSFKGKVIILCDERTQSQGEYSCMVLQTIPQAVTIGNQTAGADGNKREVPIGGGLTISYSCYGVYYPDKTSTQRVGIKIDIPVKKTLLAIKENKDEILDRALQFIIDGK